ncbi:MAG: peptidoglycan-binding domain-containing protein [Anderseniella sp.]
MVKQYGLSWALAISMGMAMVTPAHAVIVDIDIETQGEPVPGASISFRTPDGKDVPDIQVTAVPEEPEEVEEDEPGRVVELDIPPVRVGEEKPESERPEKEREPQGESRPDEPGKPRPGRHRVELPDELVGRDLVVVVTKGDEVVKRNPVKIEQDTSRIAVEAYDPVDAKLSIKLAQGKKCRRGKTCNYQLEVQNEGTGIYKGPLFLTGVLHGTVSGPGEKDGWQCVYSGRGKQICHNRVALQPGAKQSWSLGARLPRRMSQRSSNCLEINVFDQEATGRVNPLLMAVQLGLAGRGLKVGRPDGINGPKTEAALRQFTEQADYEGNDDLNDVFTALYGLSPARLSRLGMSTGKHCRRVALFAAPKRKKRISKAKRRRPQYRDDDDFDDYDDYDDYDRGRDIGIGIGLGLLNHGLHRGRGHRRGQRYD